MIDESYYSYVKPMTRGIVMNFETELQLWEEILQSQQDNKNKLNNGNYN